MITAFVDMVPHHRIDKQLSLTLVKVLRGHLR